MLQDRKEYRKNFTSTGIIYLAGERLEFIGYDVSVKGILIELSPGDLINTVADVRNLLEETQAAEVFVRDLGLSAEAKVVWVMEDEQKILLGLEFFDVRHSATKLWLRRRFYRKALAMPAKFLLDEQEFSTETIDISTDGIRLKGDKVEALKAGSLLKLFVPEKSIKALAVVVWIIPTSKSIEFGVRYINVS